MRFLNRMLIFSLCLVIIISAGAVSAADCMDNQTSDDINEKAIEDGELKSSDDLQTQINHTKDGGTLIITDDYECYELEIGKSITISGVGDNRINDAKVTITSGDVVFKNLVFNHFYGMSAKNSRLALINCTVKNFGDYGSNVYAFQAADLEIINSTFYDVNDPIGNSGNVVIANSTFERDGSNAYLHNISSIKITNSEFKNFHYFILFAHEADISASSFKHNMNLLLDFSGNATLSFNTFINNSNLFAREAYISTSSFYHDLNMILDFNGNATLSFNTFINNSNLRAINFAPEKNVAANFRMSNNVFISEPREDFYYYENLHDFNPMMLSSVYLKPSTKKIHVIPDDGDDYFTDTSLSAIYLKNNYFGFNIEEVTEFKLNNLIYIYYDQEVNAGLVNLYLEKEGDRYGLSFVDDNGKGVVMPKTVFSIIDRQSGEVIVSNISVVDGKATFDCDREISQDTVYITNCLNRIVNKPKANMTISRTGTDYIDNHVELEIKNGTMPIGNVRICVIVNQFHKDGKNITFSYCPKTRPNGTQTLDGRSSDHETYFYGPFNENDFADRYIIKIVFSDRDFGTTTQSVTYKVDDVDATLTLKSSTKTYSPDGFKYEKMSDLSPVSWKSIKYGVIKYGELYYEIYKNKKQVFAAILYCNDGVLKPQGSKLPALDAGTYKVVVRDWGGTYNTPTKTTTMIIKPAKTTVKAPKVSNKYKKSKYFKVTVKLNGNAVKNIKINLKIYTGKKSKTYVVKTDSKGIAKFNTKNLKIGKHNVVVTSKNGNYIANAKSQITIKR